MKVVLILVSVIIAITCGSLFLFSPAEQISESLVTMPKALPTPPIEAIPNDEFPDLLEWEENYEAKFDLRLMETGEFHGDEITARFGETWLGLFQQRGVFTLAPIKINVEKVFDQIVDDKKAGEQTGKRVSVGRKTQPIFLLKNANYLKRGKVETVFLEDENDEKGFEDANLDNRANKSYKLQTINYSLFVTTEKEKNSYLDETSKLVLSNGKTEQLIYSQRMCDDCGWTIKWVGDLDGDGKLDLYLDLTNHYNVSHRRLFLSSQAEKGKLVKEVANFVTSGC